MSTNDAHTSDVEIAQAIYASYGRMVLGAPPPPGSVTIDADDPVDFQRQFDALFSDDPEGGSAADHLRTPSAATDPGSSNG